MAVGIVNTAMVGSLGAVPIAAVGLSNRIVMTGWAIFQAIGTGTTVIIAQMCGAGDESRVKSVTRQAMVLSSLVSLALAALCIGFGGPMLRALGASPEVAEAGAHYLPLLSLSMPLQSIVQAAGASLRGAGDTRAPMQVALIVNLVNLALNRALIFGGFGIPALGLTGSAIATVLAQLTGMVLALLAVSSATSRIAMRLRGSWAPDLAQIKHILGIGFPAAGESLFWQAAAIILTTLVASFGTAALAAHQLGLQAESISYMPSAGFGIAAVTLVGQSIGARNPELARRYVREIALWSVVLTLVTGGILFFFPVKIMGLLTKDQEVIVLGAKYLLLMAVVQLPQQLTGVFGGALRGSGNTRTPMLVAALGVWCIRLPLSFILSRHLGMGIVGVWAAMMLDLFVRFLLTYGAYLKGGLNRSPAHSQVQANSHNNT